jgi:hypothetical protein
MSIQSAKDLVEELLTEVSKHKIANERLAYQRGYLTGLLAQLIHDDSYVQSSIEHKIKQLKHKKRRETKWILQHFQMPPFGRHCYQSS